MTVLCDQVTPVLHKAPSLTDSGHVVIQDSGLILLLHLEALTRPSLLRFRLFPEI